METYFFSSPNMLNPSFKIQNDALRLCLGAMPSTPLVSPERMHRNAVVHQAQVAMSKI